MELHTLTLAAHSYVCALACHIRTGKDARHTLFNDTPFPPLWVFRSAATQGKNQTTQHDCDFVWLLLKVWRMFKRW